MFGRSLRSLSRLKNISYINEFERKQFFVSCYCDITRNKTSRFKPQTSTASFCSEELPKNANVFGDISGRKFEHFEMDEFEKEEEDFRDTETRVPRRLKPSKGQYAKMIKSHVAKKDLASAVEVLDLVKENRDKPDIYMYNLLLRAFSMQGHLKKCFSLYNKAKKHGLQPDSATYTCLFNACAMSDNSKMALEHLNNLRRSLQQQQFQLNQTHYNVMVKAYSWHNQIIEAFQLVDEMKDNRICIGESTYNSLFHGAIAHKEAGLRYALVLWHLMCRWRIKPTLTTYNLLLRAIRDTNLGEMKVGDVLLSGYNQTRILLKEGERPDMLASPPVFSTLIPLTNTECKIVQHNTDAEVNGQNIPEEGSTNLNELFVSNRLILFGGLEGFLSRMAADDVKPDAKTITLLLDIIPNTTSAENLLIKTANEKKVELDIDFYNMLIKRRNLRLDYKAAKEVISMAERKSLSPNVMTFGVLALGCENDAQAKEFLQGIEAFGYRPNTVIMSTLLTKACLKKNIAYVVLVMNYIIENRIKPNRKMIENLKQFSRNDIPNIKKPTGKYRHRKQEHLNVNIEKFNQQYLKWQNKIKEDDL